MCPLLKIELLKFGCLCVVILTLLLVQGIISINIGQYTLRFSILLLSPRLLLTLRARWCIGDRIIFGIGMLTIGFCHL